MSRESWVTRTGEIRTKETLAGHLFSMRAAAVYDLFGQTLLQEFFKGIRTGEKDPATLIATLPGVTLSLADFINQLNNFPFQDNARAFSSRRCACFNSDTI